MSETMNSRCFSCTRLPVDPELGESLTRLSLRQVRFTHHAPLILTETECRELLSLLQRWLAQAPKESEV